MKPTFRSLILCAFASVVSSINVPAVGSIDSSSCEGGIVTKASTFKSTKGDDILMKEVTCPTGSLKVNGTNGSQKSSRLLPRQECPLLNFCELTCEGNGEQALFGDCDDLTMALIADNQISTILVVAPQTIISFEFGTCEMEYENLLESEDNSICKATFGGLGEVINEDCLVLGTGVCVSSQNDYAFAVFSTA